VDRPDSCGAHCRTVGNHGMVACMSAETIDRLCREALHTALGGLI